jgi:hypothetical protein
MYRPGDEVVNGVPVILAGRPARHRPRQFSERPNHQVVYIQDSNRLLDPTAAAAWGAGIQRSRSVSGHDRQSPAQIFIQNSNRDDHSPVRHSPVRHARRRSQYALFDDDSFDEETHHLHRHDRRGHRSRSRRRESRTPSLIREQEIEKQIDLGQRLRKLDELEQREKEEEQRRIYKQEQLIKATKEAEEKRREEEMKRKAVEEYNFRQQQEQMLKAEKEAAEKKKEEDLKRRAVEEYNKKYQEEQLRKAEQEAAEKKREEELKKKAVEEYHQKQAEKAAKEKKEKEEADKAFQERLKATFAAHGYSDESIERFLEKEGKGENKGQKKIMDLTRPTYIKVHRKHLSPDTLDAYNLPWEWDEVSCLDPSSGVASRSCEAEANE